MKNKPAYKVSVVILLLVVMALTVLVSVLLGSTKVSFGELRHFFINDFKNDEVLSQIIFQIRLPRILLALLVGASLSTAGVALQGLLRNPLADPYIIGTSSGSALGAALILFLGLHGLMGGIPVVTVASFVGAIITMYLVFKLSSLGGKLPVETFLLSGVVVGSFMSSLVSFLMAISNQNISKIVFWLMGSFSQATWTDNLILLSYFVVSAGILYLYTYKLNIYSLGEDQAAYLGINAEKLKVTVIILASMLTAAAVSVSGLIGFVGLMIPHLSRYITGADHRFLLPVSALIGGVFMVWADNIARVVITPNELPVGIITAILGAPFFCYLLYRRKSQLREV